jgi:SAM-dependent methyltransferase
MAVLPLIKRYMGNTWLHPRHLAQREIDSFVRAEGPRLKGRMLDVGCGKKPYQRYFPNVESYVGVDVPSTMHGADHADVLASVLALPFESGTFDSVLCTEVLEHTPDPNLGLREMARIAKPGATLLLTVPLSEQLHEEPNDYCRFTRHWLKYLLDLNGWRIDRIQERGGTWSELGYRFSSFLYSSLGAKKDSTGNLRPHFLLGPPVVMVCTLVQIAAHMLNKLWPSPLSTIGYGVVATRKER